MMMPQDIMDTLKQLNLLSYWKGQHFIAAPAKVVEDYWKMYNAPGGAQRGGGVGCQGEQFVNGCGSGARWTACAGLLCLSLSGRVCDSVPACCWMA